MLALAYVCINLTSTSAREVNSQNKAQGQVKQQGGRVVLPMGPDGPYGQGLRLTAGPPTQRQGTGCSIL